MKKRLNIIILLLILVIPIYASAQQLGPQVKIHVKVIEWNLSNSLDYGISTIFEKEVDDDGNFLNDPNAIVKSLQMVFPSQASTAQGVSLFFDSIDIAGEQLEIVLQLLEQSGKVNIISSPTIIAMKGAAAPSIVKTTSEVPFEAAKVAGNTVVQVTDFKETGITLEVTVEDVIDDYVKLKLKSTISSLAGFISVATDSNNNPIIVPQLSTRALRNTVLVKDSTTLISGILKVKSNIKKERTIPWLGEIPIIKYLFTSHSSTQKDIELTFLIKPEIMREEIFQIPTETEQGK